MEGRDGGVMALGFFLNSFSFSLSLSLSLALVFDFDFVHKVFPLHTPFCWLAVVWGILWNCIV